MKEFVTLVAIFATFSSAAYCKVMQQIMLGISLTAVLGGLAALFLYSRYWKKQSGQPNVIATRQIFAKK